MRHPWIRQRPLSWTCQTWRICSRLMKSRPSKSPRCVAQLMVQARILQEPETEKDKDASAGPVPLSRHKFVTLTWAEPLPNRKEAHLRLSVMRAISRLRSSGVPVLRWHADRAKEYMSHRLSEWLATQGIHETKTAPEHHSTNGRAEVAVRDCPGDEASGADACGPPFFYLWPLAIRQASEQRRAKQALGAPSCPLLAFGTAAGVLVDLHLRLFRRMWSAWQMASSMSRLLSTLFRTPRGPSTSTVTPVP